jgi:hypothetical protein
MRAGEVLSCGFACFFAAVVFAAFAGRFFAVVLLAVAIVVGEFTNPLLF